MRQLINLFYGYIKNNANTNTFEVYCWYFDYLFEFSLNVFTEFAEFSEKIFVITVKGLKPATRPPLGVRD